MDADTLSRATNCLPVRARVWAAPLTAAMLEFGIGTPLRQAMFIAQVAHESGRFQWVKELWGPTDAQRRYEGRKDLGNTQPGDGFKYRGRGPIQITGRANYQEVGEALNLPLEEFPQMLEIPEHGARAAGWFWKSHGLNEIADRGDFDGVCDVINRGHKTAAVGDSNGYADRLALFALAQKEFK